MREERKNLYSKSNDVSSVEQAQTHSRMESEFGLVLMTFSIPIYKQKIRILCGDEFQCQLHIQKKYPASENGNNCLQ
jgi:hypothetical protein